MHRKGRLLNLAHMVLAAIGGTAHNMIRHPDHRDAPLGRAKVHPRGIQVKGAETKLSRNYRRRYKHVLSDYMAEKQLGEIQRKKAKALRKAA
jgi:hypothetical protein